MNRAENFVKGHYRASKRFYDRGNVHPNVKHMKYLDDSLAHLILFTKKTLPLECFQPIK